MSPSLSLDFYQIIGKFKSDLNLINHLYMVEMVIVT